MPSSFLGFHYLLEFEGGILESVWNKCERGLCSVGVCCWGFFGLRFLLVGFGYLVGSFLAKKVRARLLRVVGGGV